MNKYEKYKNSGVDWLGEIPEGWEVNKFKSILTVHGRIGFRGYTVNDLVSEGEGAITISPSNMGDSNMIWDKVSYLSWKKYYESPEIMVEENDLLLVKTASIGKVAFVQNFNKKATINPQLLILKNISINRSFLYYQLISYVVQHQLMTEKIGSTIYTISENKVLNFKAINPPIQEQTAIANFLDDKTAKLDQAIAIKKQQIELLKERRQIIIHKAVTQGINPDVKLKDSGVEWIGIIPEGWEVKRLKYIAQINYGISPNEKTYNDEEIGTVLVNGPVEYSKTDFGYTRSLKWTTEPVKFAKKGDLLFCLRGSTTGRLNICHQDLSIGRGCASIRANSNHQFLIKAVIALKDKIIETFKGSTFPSITSFELNNYSVPVPPISEQKDIANYIETATIKIAAAISLKEQEIEKLKEYKSSLINDVVTGKVKVF